MQTRILYRNRAVAGQNGYTGSRFLEQRHHCLQQSADESKHGNQADEYKHGNYADEFNNGNDADGTSKGCTERRHALTGAATRHGKAASVLVLH